MFLCGNSLEGGGAHLMKLRHLQNILVLKAELGGVTRTFFHYFPVE